MALASCCSAASPAGHTAIATLLAAYGQSFVAMYPCLGCTKGVAMQSPGMPWLGSSSALAGLAMSGHCGAKALHVCRLLPPPAKNALPGAHTVMPCVVTILPGSTFATKLLLASFVGPVGRAAVAGAAVGVVAGVVPLPVAGVAVAVATGFVCFATVLPTFVAMAHTGQWC